MWQPMLWLMRIIVVDGDFALNMSNYDEINPELSDKNAVLEG